MLFEGRHAWFPALNIWYDVGVDGISVAMILLTAFVMLGAVLVSWRISTMGKEFFVLLLLLSAGAYGFFLSLDLFTLFFFLEVSVIPKFLLIGGMGERAKGIQRHETGVDADGWVGAGIYRAAGLVLSYGGGGRCGRRGRAAYVRLAGDFADASTGGGAANFLPFPFCGIRHFHGAVPLPHLGTGWPLFGADGGVNVPRGYLDEARRVRVPAGSGVSLMPDAARKVISPVIILLATIVS